MNMIVALTCIASLPGASPVLLGGRAGSQIPAPDFEVGPQPKWWKTTSGWGLHSTAFDTVYGKVIVHLPEEMGPGSRIGGSIELVPAGNTAAKRKENSDVLTGMVVDVAGTKTNAGAGRIHAAIPAIAGLGVVALSLSGGDGKPLASTSIPCDPFATSPSLAGNPTPGSFELPYVAMHGKPIEIRGPFDGNLDNTALTYGGKPMMPIAECNSNMIAMPHPDLIGPGEMVLTESGVNKSGTVNNLKLSMTATKTLLNRGESATVNVRVEGCNGLTEDMYPIPLEFVLETDNIRYADDGDAIRNTGISFGNVRNGVFNTSFNVVGTKLGNFAIVGKLWFNTVHDIKKKLDKKALKAWVEGIIAALQAEIAQIDAEEKAKKDKGGKWPDSPAETGRKMRRDLLKATIEKLKLGLDVADTDLGSGKIIVDKALADKSVVEVGAGLVGMALEMLGYTDIPLPGLGAVLKGAKAVTKSKKAIELIEKAEKILEGIDKIQDAAEKAEKVKEAKDLLEKAKGEMDKE